MAANSESSHESGTQDEEAAESRQMSATDAGFLSKCRIAIALGLAAFKYGASGSRVEQFLNRIITKCCAQSDDVQSAVFRVSNAEMFCSIIRRDNEWPVTVITNLEEGNHLDKFSKLSDLLRNVETGKTSLQDSIAVLQDIANAPDPYGFILVGAAWVFAGFGLPPVLGGSWWDAVVGSALSFITYLVSAAFTKFLPSRLQNPWNNVTIAFLAGILSASIKIGKPELNIVFTVLAAVAIPLPGYTVSLGVAELIVGRIITGMAHLIGGLVTLGWLVLGAYIGVFIIDRAANIPTYQGDVNTVPGPWQALLVPMLCAALAIAFQTAYRDFLPSILCQGLSYCVVVAISYIPQDDSSNNLGVVLSSVVMTLTANVWSRLKDKPTNILLTPSIVLQVSGTIGFRGIVELGKGDTAVGLEQLLRMFYVAILIFVGVAIAMSIYWPSLTI